MRTLLGPLIQYLVTVLIAFMTSIASGVTGFSDRINVTSYLPEDHFLGKVDAPITVIDYSSLTCPHCAEFHIQVLPKFKANFIDTGKVKFIYRDFSLDAVATSAALIAHCAPPDIYFRFLDLLFRNQKVWSKSTKPREALTTLAKFGSMTEKEANACLDNEELLNDLILVKNEARTRYNIKSTPSFVIGSHTYIGTASYEVFSALVEVEIQKKKEKSQ